MNDEIKDFLINIMSAFSHSFIKYYVNGGFEITLDQQNVLWFSLGEIESDIELNGCNKPIAIKFIESGYDLNILKQLIAERDNGAKE